MNLRLSHYNGTVCVYSFYHACHIQYSMNVYLRVEQNNMVPLLGHLLYGMDPTIIYIRYIFAYSIRFNVVFHTSY